MSAENPKVLLVTDETSGMTSGEGRVVVGAYLTDWNNKELEDRTGEGVINILRANPGKFITTAAPGFTAFEDIYRSNIGKYEGIVTVLVNQHLSSFMKSADTAKNNLGGDGEKIHLTGGLPGFGLMRLVEEAENMASQGKSAEEIARALENAEKLIAAYLIADPVYLKQSGRIAFIAQYVGGFITPVARIDDKGQHLSGVFRKRGKPEINSRNTVGALYDRISGTNPDGISHIEIVHTGGAGEEQAETLKKALNMGNKVGISHAGSFISAHIGPDGLGTYIELVNQSDK